LHPPSKLDLSSRPGICTIFYHDDEQRNISNGTRMVVSRVWERCEILVGCHLGRVMGALRGAEGIER
jgi:hypothetical protein